MSKKWLLSLCSVLLLAAVTACGGGDGDGDTAAADKPSAQQGESQPGGKSAGPTPDLSDVPKVVAEVNGKNITKAEFSERYKGQFQQLAMQSQMSGQQLDQDKLKKQVVDAMIGTELLVQEAGKRGFTASAKDVTKTLEELARSSGMKSGDQFMAALKKQGMGEREIRSQLKIQYKVDRLIATEAGNTEPTEAEIKRLYDQMVARQQQSGGGGGQSKLPPFEQVKPQLREQAKSQKEAEAAQALVTKYRKKADVTINL